LNNPVDFSGKVALFTGAASGIGLATAQAFAEAGAAVARAGVKEDADKLLAEGAASASGTVPTYKEDDVRITRNTTETAPGPKVRFTGTVFIA
jgi:NAD(P)-dependent dehydrogenase (short-subunit alcohol dehydrogenase family)